MIAHTRRFALPLVAITGRSGSTLARAADVALVLPSEPEACPMGLAPTTSTTMQLALGDAIASPCSRARGSRRVSSASFHPGGKLGARLTHVRDLMHVGGEIPLAPAAMPMGRAIIAMTEKRFGLPWRDGRPRPPRRHRDRWRFASCA